MKTAAFALVVSLAAFAACSKPEGDRASSGGAPTPLTAPPWSGPAPSTLSPAAEAEDIYRTRCAMCHGDSGHGDGPSARMLQPKPRDFGDKAFQAATTDEAIAKAIVEGGEAVGKSSVMPSSPELASKPEVVKELVKTVRAFRR